MLRAEGLSSSAPGLPQSVWAFPAAPPLPGESAAQSGENARHNIRVKVGPPANPPVTRTVAILKDRIEQRCAANVTEAQDRARIILTVHDRLAPEAFRFDRAGGAVRVSGGSPRGLLYGGGKFLRTSRYDGGFQPSAWRGTSKPHGSLRGMYFASHFHNWYVQASPYNFATSAAGPIRTEIQDAAGQPISGFAAGDCGEVVGNEIERVIRWKSATDVSSLAGKTVRLRFVIKDADLYALRFAAAPAVK